MRRVVVVGAGLAGLRAAQELRERGFDGDLTIVGNETHRPYNRPPLSKQFLLADMKPDECEFGDDLDAQWLLGRAAAGLDTGSRLVRLADGVELPYDGVVIATGRRAREWPSLPPMAGFHVLRGLDDAVAFRAALTPSSKVAIVGAGFIGCEVAATLRKRGIEEVSLIDVAAHPMPALGPEMGRFATELHTEHGIKLYMETKIERFEGDESVRGVRLTDGGYIAADVVLISLGSVPNTEWLDGSGLTLHEGSVLCDEFCFAVGHRDVVAAGDIATWPHPQVGDSPIRIEHWTNAADMARFAAGNLLDPDSALAYSPVPSFWSDQYNAKIRSAGFYGRADSVSVVEQDPESGSLVIEGYRNNEMVGALTVNKNRAYLGYLRTLTQTAKAQA